MNESVFWNIVDTARSNSADCGEFNTALTIILNKLPHSQVKMFKNIVDAKIVELYRWDIWGIACIVNGGCSDDGFEYFRRWVITQERIFIHCC